VPVTVGIETVGCCAYTSIPLIGTKNKAIPIIARSGARTSLIKKVLPRFDTTAIIIYTSILSTLGCYASKANFLKRRIYGTESIPR
jgi:hypothetical protein